MSVPYELTVIAAPASEPLTLDEAKAQLRLTAGFTADDSYITSLISVARDHVEKYCNRYFTAQTVAINWLVGFPPGPVRLPFPDLAAVASVKYTDGSDAEQTVDPGDYTFNSEQRLLYPASSWPADAQALRVEVTTAAPAEFEGAKQAMLMVLTDLYELRVESVVGASVATNPAVRALCYPYRFNLGI